MPSTCITSTFSLRAKGQLLFPFNDYTHCSNEGFPFVYSSHHSSRTCCSCCANSLYKVPISSTYCCNLQGLRQSSLIQWSPGRRRFSGGLDRCYYLRLPVCDGGRSYYCDKISRFKEKRVGRSRGELRKCMVFEERNERFDLEGDDEIEVLLDLLIDDVDTGDDFFHVRKKTNRLFNKPVVERRDECEVRNRYKGKKKRLGLDVLESEGRCGYESNVSYSKNEENRTVVRSRKEENREALLRKENQKMRIQEEKKETFSTKEREDAKSRASSRLACQKYDEEKERESLTRKEDWKLREKDEESEDLLRREKHRQRVRKDGSSCSSYYSFSSNGDYESDVMEIDEASFSRDSANGYKRNERNNEMVYQETGEDKKNETYREDIGISLTKKSFAQESRQGSSIAESDFRKKSEKKLSDLSIEEINSKRGSLQKKSEYSIVHESSYNKSSDTFMKSDNRKVTPTGSAELDLETKQNHRQNVDELARQSESKMKYKQFSEISETTGNDDRTTSGHQNMYSSKYKKPDQVTSSSQEAVREHQTSIGLNVREEKYQRDFVHVSAASKVEDTDIRKTSISRQRFETRGKVEQEVRGQSQQSAKKQSSSIVRKEPDSEFINQEGNMNIAYWSSGSKEQHSRSDTKFSRGGESRNESGKLHNTSLARLQNPGAVVVHERHKRISEAPAGPPHSRSGSQDAPSVEPKGEIALNKVSDDSLQQGSALLRRHLERPPALPHESFGRGQDDGMQASEFASHEDAIGSAALLEKSSAYYVDDFVHMVRQEIQSSEIQEGKTNLVGDEQNDQKRSSGGSEQHELSIVKQASGVKGPSDEMWKLDEPSNQELPKVDLQEDANKAGNAIVKRSGRSLWNIIGDIVRLRWSSRSETHGNGGRSSPNQSASSETWFSGHEAEENEVETGEKEQKSISQAPTYGLQRQEGKFHSQFEEGSSSSTSRRHLERVRIKPPESVGLEGGSAKKDISSPSTEEISISNIIGTTSAAAAVLNSSVSLPVPRLRRSPIVRRGSESGEENVSDCGTSEQLKSELTEQNQPELNEGEQKRKLQRKDQVLTDKFDEWAEAYRLESEQRKIDEVFMREALLEAQKAADNWEVPVGAVLVHNGKIIARGCNLVEELRDSTAHAEMICIREASNVLRSWRLSDSTLYVTLEPCPMCAGAILQARVDTVVWGAPNKLLGADGSWIRLFPNGDGGNGMEQTDKPAAPVHPFHPKITIRRGVLASECADAMQQFFQLRRKKKDKKSESPPPSCLPVSHHPSKFLTKIHDVFNLTFCL